MDWPQNTLTPERPQIRRRTGAEEAFDLAEAELGSDTARLSQSLTRFVEPIEPHHRPRSNNPRPMQPAVAARSQQCFGQCFVQAVHAYLRVSQEHTPEAQAEVPRTEADTQPEIFDSRGELLELYLCGAQRNQRLRIAGIELHRPL